jgi:hypothetical protein
LFIFYPIRTRSSELAYDGCLTRPASNSTSVRGPNRPTNIAKIRIKRDQDLNSVVIPLDNPLVPKAETISKTTFSKGKLGSMRNRNIPKNNSAKKVRDVIPMAPRTLSNGI